MANVIYISLDILDRYLEDVIKGDESKNDRYMYYNYGNNTVESYSYTDHIPVSSTRVFLGRIRNYRRNWVKLLNEFYDRVPTFHGEIPIEWS